MLSFLRPLFVLLVCLLTTAGAQVPESSLDRLLVGHWAEVRGELNAEGIFVAKSVELVQPSTAELIGTVPKTERGIDRIRVLGQEVHLSPKTKWSGLEPGPLAGLRVKIEGRLKGPRNFSAEKIKPRKPGSDRLTGRINWIEETPGGGREFGLFSLRVRVPAGLVLTHEEPLASYVTTPAPAWVLDTSAQDEDDQLGPGLRIADGMTLSGQLEFKGRQESEYDLDWGTPADRLDLFASSRLRLDWSLAEDLDFAIEWRHTEDWREDEPSPTDHRATDRLGQTYLHKLGLLDLPIDLVVGRQDFDDPREWVYDQNLDGVRGTWYGSKSLLELSVSTTLTDGKPIDEAATNWIAYWSNRNRASHLAAYAVHRDFGDGFDERRTNLGLRAIGQFLPQNESWCELAWAGGRDGAEDVSGYALDLGTVWEPETLPVKLVAGWAFGSGDDDPSDGVAHDFRQTGLEDNNGKLGGVTSLRYYGELVDPELSNLSILTGGIVLPFGERESASLLWHKFDQVEANSSLRNTDLDLSPSGLDTDLGWEIDFVLASRRFAHWDIELISSYFEPGNAFPFGQAAALLQLQLRYRL